MDNPQVVDGWETVLSADASAQAVAAFNKAASEKLICWRLKTPDEVACLEAAVMAVLKMEPIIQERLPE